jgi:predicted dehydrogenase
VDKVLDHILICGLGSIGRRHFRHFRKLGVTRIDAFRTGKSTLPDDERPAADHTFYSLEEALAQAPQAVIVTNPTALHLATAEAAVKAGAHVLVEKPLSHTLDGCEDFLSLAKSRERTVAVGCNLRFHPLLLALQDMIAGEDLGVPLLARAHFGAYLPDWHPWEDYHESYAARRTLGGGATLTHIHEIDYLLWLFGPAKATEGFCSELHPLETDVDEASVGIIRHRSGAISTLSLSLCQKPQTRWLEVAFEEGIAQLDLIENVLIIEDAEGSRSWKSVQETFSVDQTYARQAEALMAAISGHDVDNLCTGAEAFSDLEVALSILEGKE